MNSLSSGIGSDENIIYETQGINLENISLAQSKKLGKDLYLLLAKKRPDLRSFRSFFGIIRDVLPSVDPITAVVLL